METLFTLPLSRSLGVLAGVSREQKTKRRRKLSSIRSRDQTNNFGDYNMYDHPVGGSEYPSLTQQWTVQEVPEEGPEAEPEHESNAARRMRVWKVKKQDAELAMQQQINRFSGDTSLNKYYLLRQEVLTIEARYKAFKPPSSEVGSGWGVIMSKYLLYKDKAAMKQLHDRWHLKRAELDRNFQDDIDLLVAENPDKGNAELNNLIHMLAEQIRSGESERARANIYPPEVLEQYVQLGPLLSYWYLLYDEREFDPANIPRNPTLNQLETLKAWNETIGSLQEYVDVKLYNLLKVEHEKPWTPNPQGEGNEDLLAVSKIHNLYKDYFTDRYVDYTHDTTRNYSFGPFMTFIEGQTAEDALIDPPFPRSIQNPSMITSRKRFYLWKVGKTAEQVGTIYDDHPPVSEAPGPEPADPSANPVPTTSHPSMGEPAGPPTAVPTSGVPAVLVKDLVVFHKTDEVVVWTEDQKHAVKEYVSSISTFLPGKTHVSMFKETEEKLNGMVTILTDGSAPGSHLTGEQTSFCITYKDGVVATCAQQHTWKVQAENQDSLRMQGQYMLGSLLIAKLGADFSYEDSTKLISAAALTERSKKVRPLYRDDMLTMLVIHLRTRWGEDYRDVKDTPEITAKWKHYFIVGDPEIETTECSDVYLQKFKHLIQHTDYPMVGPGFFKAVLDFWRLPDSVTGERYNTAFEVWKRTPTIPNVDWDEDSMISRFYKSYKLMRAMIQAGRHYVYECLRLCYPITVRYDELMLHSLDIENNLKNPNFTIPKDPWGVNVPLFLLAGAKSIVTPVLNVLALVGVVVASITVLVTFPGAVYGLVQSVGIAPYTLPSLVINGVSNSLLFHGASKLFLESMEFLLNHETAEENFPIVVAAYRDAREGAASYVPSEEIRPGMEQAAMNSQNKFLQSNRDIMIGGILIPKETPYYERRVGSMAHTFFAHFNGYNAVNWGVLAALKTVGGIETVGHSTALVPAVAGFIGPVGQVVGPVATAVPGFLGAMTTIVTGVMTTVFANKILMAAIAASIIFADVTRSYYGLTRQELFELMFVGRITSHIFEYGAHNFGFFWNVPGVAAYAERLYRWFQESRSKAGEKLKNMFRAAVDLGLKGGGLFLLAGGILLLADMDDDE
jgi:hypothetical protein